METSKYNVGDVLWHTEARLWVTIKQVVMVHFIGSTYKATYNEKESEWVYCIDSQLSEVEIPEKTYYWISHVEKVNVVYGYKVEADSVEEAKEKAQNNDYVESKFLGIDQDCEVDIIDADWATVELDYEEIENMVEPEYPFYTL